MAGISKGRSSDLSPLDGIRGVCSILIVAGHFFTYWAPKGGNVDGTSVPFIGIEYLSAVTLFFVISGFTLVQVYDKSVDGRHDPNAIVADVMDTKTFWRRRVARLAPLYYAGLLLGVGPLIAYYGPTDIATAVPICMLWLQSISIVGNDVNPPLWTVSAFALSYLTFPWLLRRLKATKNSTLIAIIITLTVFSTALMVGAMNSAGVSVGILLHIFGPLRLPHFAVGVAAGLLQKRWSLTRPTLIAEICSTLLLLNLAAAGAVTAIGRSLGSGVSLGLWAYYSYAAECFLPPVHAAWVMALTSPTCTGPTKWVLTTKPLAWLGRLSYALYCTHWPIIFYCAFALAGGVSSSLVPTLHANGADGWFAFPPWAIFPILCICLTVAAVLHFALEGPARAAIAGRREKGDTGATTTTTGTSLPFLLGGDHPSAQGQGQGEGVNESLLSGEAQ